MGYWAERIAKAQTELTNRNTKRIEKQLKKYYASATERTINNFIATYNKIQIAIEQGKEPTPADLYKLDKYWKTQAQLRQELRRLGEKQIALLTKQFEIQYFDIYYSFALEGIPAYTTPNKGIVNQLINSIWCADGKSFSQRIWQNTELLVETLNEELIHCVINGQTTRELKNKLQERFAVSYGRADALVRTELAHIQTEAAKQRYKDYGLQEVEILADKDERRCEICGKLHKKRYPIGANVPIPAHPKCRCCIVPVIE
jgi:SPP1 gp7 family putative phage head morphogenesis protein